ncbi:hypothetical protein [Mesorhizobium sp.]|uniref:hypothetical protein n=1 Tax=Mesorhizobium sp. TaxID=1871066 RepID=UPI000FE460D7|nr:hypothetical protein [Mesorhizobium sp.]RWP72376.1 MAG: hypothetical protein EOR09_21265 [Mesorhizobium sp.]
MTKINRHIIPAPIGYSLTSHSSPGELAEALDVLAARTGDRRFERARRELLRPCAGQRSPATSKAIAQRDEAIREMSTFCLGSRWSRSQEIHKLLLRYSTTTWRFGDDRLEEMPSRYLQTPYAGAFAVLRSGQPVPGPRQLHKILKG